MRALVAILLLAALVRPAAAYPYLALRPAESALAGPTEPQLSALHYNPAALRLLSGIQLSISATALVYLGSYQREAPLPAGYAPGQGASRALAQHIRWAAPSTFVAASWDLGSESVTLGAGFYLPYVDGTRYGGDERSLPTRYHAITDLTHSLWGTLGAALKVSSMLYLGAVFNFAWTLTEKRFFLDPDPLVPDGLSCGDPARCEQYQNRREAMLNVSGMGYGFSAGALFSPLKDRLWIGASYTLPLLTDKGPFVPLSGQPEPDDARCLEPAPERPATERFGLMVLDPGTGRGCVGAAQLQFSTPHLIYLGARLRLASPSPRRSRPGAWEVGLWSRITIPVKDDLELRAERRAFSSAAAGGAVTSLSVAPVRVLKVAQRTAVAINLDVRQSFRRIVLAEALMYESPRTSLAAVSPANLDGHKIDLMVTLRAELNRLVWVSLSVGLTYVLIGDGAGQGYDAAHAEECRRSGYSIVVGSCQATQDGWALPAIMGNYSLAVLHGGAALGLKL